MVERAADLSDEVLERVGARQRAAIEAIRKFVDALDDAVPNLVDDPSVRKKAVDVIGDYYEQLATTTNELVAGMVRSAIGTLNDSAAKPAAKRAVAAQPAAKRAANKAPKRAAKKAD